MSNEDVCVYVSPLSRSLSLPPPSRHPSCICITVITKSWEYVRNALSKPYVILSLWLKTADAEATAAMAATASEKQRFLLQHL